MSYLEYINEVKVSGIVISAGEKKMTDQSIGLLIKLKNRMKTEVDGEITEREFSVQIKVSPEMYSTCFTGINQGDELMVSGYIVVDTIMIEGREHPLDYMRVVATSKLAHIPKPLKGFGQSSFNQI
jgi:primosomal replication protein N